MKKSLLICLLVTNCMHLLNAQDQLFKKDNSKLLVKIVEIGTSEIRYKLFENLSGPIYTESKANVTVIIYENGQAEVIKQSETTSGETGNNSRTRTQLEEYNYEKYANNISLNFLSFFNNEVGLIYQRDFFKGQFNIIVPIAFGLEKPTVTQSVYHGRSNYNYDINNYYGNYHSYTLLKKIFEAGFGINYYPNTAGNLNYYVGPAFRFMQYDARQSANFYDPNNQSSLQINHASILSRYCVSVTNGLLIRTHSRLTVNMFASLGFKNDVASNPIVDPYTNSKVMPSNNSFSLYFWSGINIGINF